MTLHLKREAKNYPEEHKGHDSVTALPALAQSLQHELFSRHAAADADGHRRAGAAAGLRQRGESDAGALGGAAARNRHPHVARREPLATGSPVAGRKPDAGAGRRRGGVADHALDRWDADEVRAGDGFSDSRSASRRTAPSCSLTLVISLLTGVIFGILPALRSSTWPDCGAEGGKRHRSGGLRKARLASGLVVAQISLSLVLPVCAGLFIRSFLSAQKIDLGFNERNVLIASYDLFTAGYSEEKGAEFDRQLEAKLEAVAGVQAVALASREPGLSPGSTSVKPEGYVSQTNDTMETPMAIVTPNYFQTMQMPLVKGREFTRLDNAKRASAW